MDVEIIALSCIFIHVKTAHLMATILLVSSLPCAFGAQDSSPTPTATPTPTPAASPKPPLKLRVSSGVAEGLIVRKVNPKYPPEARKNHIQGDVILQMTIDKQGNITNVNVVKGEPILADAAVEAVKQWKYKPYLLKGEPVEVETTVLIKFHM
jgi:protein TonB